VESAFRSALSAYREAYVAYVRRRDPAREPLDPAPRVVLVPGIGMFTGGRDAAEAALAGQIFLHTLRIMENAAALGGYRSLGEEDAFDAEYWPLELHKLSLPRRGGEMAGRVALVTGGGGAIGRAVCRALAGAGACVLVTDLDPVAAAGTADAAAEGAGPERVRPCGMDVTRERDVEAAFEDACLAFGGVDVVVSNAGVAYCASLEDTTLAQWQTSLAVNATGHFLVARAALRLFRRQGTGGSLVFVGTKNVTAPGRDFGAYSASKAAEAQLARVAAIEAGAMGVRVNVVNPDAVFGDSRLWSPALRASRAQSHGIAPDQLSDFYRGRSLLGVEVRAEDVADAVLFLAGPRASRTTGAMLAVDAGVREAFPR
jgi:NAD(P)-dependent dehydrogenase (short-subunit alcohol dehydrogenase family)